MIVVFVCALFVFIDAEPCQECGQHWPESTCSRGKCRCPPNSLKVPSSSMQWVCLSVNDIATGEIGPPLTCPFPEGAGYKVVHRSNHSPSFCDSKNEDVCPAGYECVRSLGVIGSPDGVCCPNRESMCKHPIFDHDDGSLSRFGFDGQKCVSFSWNPERLSTANNFRTMEQCEHYCLKWFQFLHSI